MKQTQLQQLSKAFLNVTKYISCSICHKIITKSVDLICNHIFCQDCFNNTKAKRKCPICHRSFKARNPVYNNTILDELGLAFNKFYEKIKLKYDLDFNKLGSEELSKKPSSIKKIGLKKQDSALSRSISKAENLEDDIVNIKDSLSTRIRKYGRPPIKEKKKQTENKAENAFDKLMEAPQIQVKKPTRSSKRRSKKLTNDFEGKSDVLCWLNNNKNKFDRLTQTQQFKGDEFEFPDGPSPSVSQLKFKQCTNPRRSKCQSNTRIRCKSMEAQVKKKNVTDRKKRHSICTGALENDSYIIEDIETDEINLIKQAEEKVLEDLLEDVYLDKLDFEMKNADKVVNSGDKKSGAETKITSPTGWDRMKDINEKISKKGKSVKKLNVSLRTSNEFSDISEPTKKKTRKSNENKNADEIQSGAVKDNLRRTNETSLINENSKGQKGKVETLTEIDHFVNRTNEVIENEFTNSIKKQSNNITKKKIRKSNEKKTADEIQSGVVKDNLKKTNETSSINENSKGQKGKVETVTDLDHFVNQTNKLIQNEFSNSIKKQSDNILHNVSGADESPKNKSHIHIIYESYSNNKNDEKIDNHQQCPMDIEEQVVLKPSEVQNLSPNILDKLHSTIKNCISVIGNKITISELSNILPALQECEKQIELLKLPHKPVTLEKAINTNLVRSVENKINQTNIECKNIDTQTEDVSCARCKTGLKTVRDAEYSLTLSSHPLDNCNFNSQEILLKADLAKKVDEVETKQESEDDIIHNVSNKRRRVIDSDSEDDILVKKPCNRFMKSSLSIKFDSQVESASVTQDKLDLSENIDYDDYLAKVMKKYDNPSNESISSQVKEQASIKSIPDKENNIINNKNPKEHVFSPPPFRDSVSQLSLSSSARNPKVARENKSQNVPSLPNSAKEKFEDENYFDECLSKLDKEIEEYENHSKHDNTEMSDIISETEDLEPVKKLRKHQKECRNTKIKEKNLEISDFNNEDMDIDEAELILIEEQNKINVIHDVVVKGSLINTENKKDDDDVSESEVEDDVIESTPPKKITRSDSQIMLSQIPDFTSMDLAEFDVVLPPPSKFCDEPPSEIKIVSQRNGSFETPKHSQAGIPDTSTPHARHRKPDLHFSPIFSQNNNCDNVKPKFPSQKLFTDIPSQKFTPKKNMLSCIPGQKSIFNYVKSTPISQFNASTSGASDKPLITSTRVDKDQLFGISTLAHRKLISYTSTYSDNVTHLIANVDENNYVEEHTMKFILAVASGIWVLNYQWVKECLAQNRIVSEAPYEVLDGSGIAGPKISRLTRSTNPLFRGFKFCCLPPFQSAVKDDVEKVVKLLDGKITDLNAMGSNDGLHGIIVSEIVGTQDFDIYEKFLENFKCITVDLEWISKSVAQYRLTSVRPYLLCSEDYLSELGYPAPLLDIVPLTGTEDV